ncbi:LytS/YhcK type 5TM receptor domain-containing protein [Niallia oryzisoli]|uniref:LytS/YhcK type 5TM receptor domain-containing protein n=1 Tax=Niallia oryzisoli TaxID=1737571 RepID=A0ABZ2C7V9_9BACI
MSDILVNVLFLLVMLFLTQLFLEVYRKEFTKKDIKLFVFLSGLVSFIFFVFFPFSSNEGINYDIRVVPFIVASLYGGPLASFCLYICGFFVRLCLGINETSWITASIYALIPLLTILFYHPFLKARRSQKLWISIGILFIHMFFSVLINNYMFHLEAPFNIILMGALIKLVCIILTVWTYEKIILNHHLKNELLEMEKMEMVSHLSASVAHEI